jgi:hypothetical protein
VQVRLHLHEELLHLLMNLLHLHRLHSLLQLHRRVHLLLLLQLRLLRLRLLLHRHLLEELLRLHRQQLRHRHCAVEVSLQLRLRLQGWLRGCVQTNGRRHLSRCIGQALLLHLLLHLRIVV